MKIRRMLCVAIMLVFLTAGALPAAAIHSSQTSESTTLIHPEWTSYTNGNWINDLTFDTDGYLWAATSGGAVRWDVDNRVYTKFTSEHGLCSNQLSALALAPDGSLWFASMDNGISSLQDGVFQNYTISDGLPSNVINDITVDSSGTLWIATDYDICSYDGQSWTTYPDTPMKEYETTTDYILADAEGSIWCGSHFSGVFRLSQGVWTQYNDPQVLSSMVNSMTLAADGTVWASLLDVDLVQYRGETAEIVQLATDSFLYIDCVYAAQDGAIWFTNWGDVVCVKNEQWETFTDDYEQATDTTCIIEGSDGTIWCGGFMGGLAGYKDGEWTVLQTEDWLPDNTVRKIVETETGGLWILSATAVSYYDGTAAQVYPTNSRALDLLIAPDGAAWVSIGGNGVYRFDGSQWVFNGPGDIQDGFLDNSLGAFLDDLEDLMGDDFGDVFGEGEDSLGDELWGDLDADEEAILIESTQMGAGIETNPWYTSIAMTPDGKLLCVTTEETVHSLYNGQWSVYAAKSDAVSDLYISDMGVYWLSCSEGLYNSPDGNNWSFYPEIIDPNYYIYHYGNLYVSADDDCWIASLSGIGCQPADGESFYFMKGGDIPDQNVACITGTPDGTIWMGTVYVMTSASGSGTGYYDGSRWTMLTAADGLASNAVHDICANEDTVWLGTNGGISVYRPCQEQ